MTKIDLTRLPLLAIALVALAACGSKDDTPAVAQPAAQAEARPESAPAEAAPEQEAAPIAAIEESDGSVDPAEENTESLRLAQADVPLSAVPTSRFREGQHYNRWRPARMKVTGTDGVEVTEVFWYGCSTCNKFEPLLNRWVPDLPQGVEFVKLPAVWNPTLEKHAQLYSTIEALANAGNRTARALRRQRSGFRMGLEVSLGDHASQPGQTSQRHVRHWRRTDDRGQWKIRRESEDDARFHARRD